MKVILAMVSSINGKITKDTNSNIYTWTSYEDKKLFFLTLEKHNLIVMGAKTYEAARKIIKLKTNQLRIVLTRNPKKYNADKVLGSLEFSSEAPYELIKRLEKEGHSKMLLVGGGEISWLFLKDHLVDELHLTIEPFIFGKGKNLVAEEDLEVRLKLLDIKKLNAKGTLHLRYRVEK